jgi:hypothetical protein
VGQWREGGIRPLIQSLRIECEGDLRLFSLER